MTVNSSKIRSLSLMQFVTKIQMNQSKSGCKITISSKFTVSISVAYLEHNALLAK